MPRDGAGLYTLPPGINPVVPNTVIADTWANPTMADFAVQLNNVVTRDGVLPVNLPFKLVDGTVGAPGLAFQTQTNLGLYRSAANILAVSVGGVNTAAFGANGFASVLGAVATPSYAFLGDLDTGFWSPTANTVALSTNAVERMRWDATGNVAIGATPTAVSTFRVLDITGPSTVTGGIWSLNNSDRSTIFRGVSSDTGGTLELVSNLPMLFNTNSLTRMAILGAGNVLVGLTATTGFGQFQVQSAAASAADFFTTALNTKVRIRSGGAANAATLSFQNGTSGTGVSDGFEVGLATDGLTASLFNGENGDMLFSTNGTNRGGWKADGRLFGKAIHNSAGAVTGTTDQFIGSGTYNPVASNGANAAGLSATVNAPWTRVGNVVTVSVSIAFSASVAATPTSVLITLPIASATTNAGQGACCVSRVATNIFENGLVQSDGAGAMRIRCFPADTAARIAAVIFSYEVT